MSRTLFMVLSTAAIAWAANDSPRVLGIVGHWEVDGSGKAVHFGDALDYRDRVRCTSRGSLNILFPEIPDPVTLKSEGAGQLTSLLELRDKNRPSPGKSAGAAFSRFFSLISIEFSREPTMYIAAVSRGVGEAELSDGVLELKAGGVDLRPAFGDSPGGTYPIAFTGVAATNIATDSVPIKWQPGAPAIVAVPAAFSKRGLVKIAILDPEGGYRSSAWALLSPSAAYAKDEAQFQEGLNIVKNWPGGEGGQSSRSALRAYLRAIADGQPR
jgi:hypothetical protein